VGPDDRRPAAAPPAAAAPDDAGGPRIDPQRVSLRGDRVLLHLDKPLQARSVDPQAFEVAVFEESAGWTASAVAEARFTARGATLTLRLGGEPHGQRLRIIARGTGPRPLLGRDLVPLAGGSTDPRPGTTHDGRDFVHMLEL
jgi:hypothetical protein